MKNLILIILIISLAVCSSFAKKHKTILYTEFFETNGIELGVKKFIVKSNSWQLNEDGDEIFLTKGDVCSYRDFYTQTFNGKTYINRYLYKCSNQSKEINIIPIMDYYKIGSHKSQ